jgi:hypothetical protein
MSREQQLKEARTIEAMKNGYMGMEGQFATIAKRLGQPIYRQGSHMFEQTFMDDPYELPDEDAIPMMDEDEQSYEMGLQFDGLTRGMNLTISVEYHLRVITVRHEGKVVYLEVSGELEGYAPGPWEDKIKTLHTLAKKIERQQRPHERRAVAEAADKKRKEILDALRDKWGL